MSEERGSLSFFISTTILLDPSGEMLYTYCTVPYCTVSRFLPLLLRLDLFAIIHNITKKEVRINNAVIVQILSKEE
jgi:hypothetical protein